MDEPVCRYCHQPEGQNRPLASPCGCQGTNQWMHPQCQAESLRNVKPDTFPFPCENCKQPFTNHHEEWYVVHRWRWQGALVAVLFLLTVLSEAICGMAVSIRLPDSPTWGLALWGFLNHLAMVMILVYAGVLFCWPKKDLWFKATVDRRTVIVHRFQPLELGPYVKLH